jgi:hypothetical protein
LGGGLGALNGRDGHVPVGNAMRWVEARHAMKTVLVVMRARLSGVVYDQKSDHKFRVEGFYRDASAMLHYNQSGRIG